MEINENTNFGFVPSVMDGTEWIFSSTPEMKLPTKYNYKAFLPTVIDQGSLSICVPCSCSAYLNWKANLAEGMNHRDNKVALMDIYGIKTNVGDGMSFKEALHYLRHEGVRSNIGLLKINSYGKITSPISLRYALIMNGPCLGALPVYSSDCDFWNKKPGQSLCGYHAISIVGYDEDGFIIRNSWGRSFCDDGYTHIPIEEFNKIIEAWTIID
jgi:hypothetical protein